MTTALIDGDLVAYRCAASAEHDGVGIAFIRASRLLQDIISVTDANEIKLYLSGTTNFRYDLYPEYKANRKDMVRPRHLEPLREYLILKWGAEVTDGYEADDAIGISMSEGTGQRVVSCSLDKDLRQLPGTHYNFVTGMFEEINEIEGWYNFYSQLVLGDRADNVPGYDGKMRPRWPKFLAETRAKLYSAGRPYDMFEVVRALYNSQETLITNARLLYIWRKPNDEWQVPTKVETTSEEKLEVETKSESTPMKQVESTPSTERGITKRNKGGSRRRGPSKGRSSRKTNRARSTST